MGKKKWWLNLAGLLKCQIHPSCLNLWFAGRNIYSKYPKLYSVFFFSPKEKGNEINDVGRMAPSYNMNLHTDVIIFESSSVNRSWWLDFEKEIMTSRRFQHQSWLLISHYPAGYTKALSRPKYVTDVIRTTWILLFAGEKFEDYHKINNKKTNKKRTRLSKLL